MTLPVFSGDFVGGARPAIAEIHLMDTLSFYDYRFFNDNIDLDGDGKYTAEGERAGGNVAELLGVKDIVVDGEIKRYGYNSYLKSLVADGETLNTVVIAVIDTGINMEHEIFEGRILTAHARNFVADAEGNTGVNDLRDNVGHGTHTAGTICDMTLPNVKILPIKIFDSKSTDPNLIPPAIEYLVGLKKKGMNIVAVNMSLGTDPMSPSHSLYFSTKSFYQSCINTLVNAGILPIVAVGNGANSGNGSVFPSFPSACVGAVSVSAFSTKPFVNYDKNYDGEIKVEDGEEEHDFDGDGEPDLNNAFSIQRAYYSNYAGEGYDSRVDITAPGGYDEWITPKQGIWSATKTGTDTIYNTQQGTSMATPFVAALYALLCSDPTQSDEDWREISQWTSGDGADYLTPIHKALFDSAVAVGQSSTRADYFGRGCVSVAAFTKDFDDWIDPDEYEAAVGAPIADMTRIIVQTTGGGSVLQNDYMPIAEYALTGTGTDFGVWVTAGGGYSILSVKVGGSEVSLSLTNTEYISGKLVCGKYTFTNLPASSVTVVVQFSTFSTEQVNYVKPTKMDTAGGKVDFPKLLFIVLGVGGLIAGIYFLQNRKPKESLLQSGDGDTDAEVERIIKIMEKKGRPQGSSLDKEIESIMREIESGEDEEGEDYE
jgi:subtilisin family serine protease